MKNFKQYISEGIRRVGRLERSIKSKQSAMEKLNSKLSSEKPVDYQPSLFSQIPSESEKLYADKNELSTSIETLNTVLNTAKDKVLRSRLRRLKPIESPHKYGYDPLAYPSYDPMDINILDIKRD